MTDEGLLLVVEPIRRRAEHARAAPGRGSGPGRDAADRVRCSRALLATAPRCPARDAPHASAVALGAEFTPEPCAVAAAFGPAMGEVGFVWSDIAGLLGLGVCRRSAGLQPAIDRRHARTHGTTDGMARQAQPMQPQDFLIADLTAISSICPQAVLVHSRRQRGFRRSGRPLRHGTRSLADSAAVAVHPALQGLAQVAKEVPAVGDLHGIRCTLPDGVSIGAGAVASDDLDPAVTPQPSRERAGLAVGQKIDDPIALQVDQNGSVGLAAPPGPVIHSQHARRRRQRRHRAMNQAQQSIGAHRHGQALGKAGAGLAA